MINGKKKNTIKSFVLTLLCLVLIIAVLPTEMSQVHAASTGRLLTLNQAKALAVAKSEKIEKVEMQIKAKKAALLSAVKAIAVKQKNMRMFRWTPLLSFKLPTKAKLVDASMFELKPIQIQYEIDKLEHKLTDLAIQEHETVNNLYVDIVVLEETIDFNTERAQIMGVTLEKNKTKLMMGGADQSEISDMEKALNKINQSLSSDKDKLIAKKKKLSKKLGVNVNTGFRFENPFVQSELDRSILPEIIEYTLDRDDNYYDTCVAETSARVATQTNYSLMKNQYAPKYMNLISPYVDAILRGEKVKAKHFNKAYKQLVSTVNERWDGVWTILYFDFPKNWFQGQIDGDRFIEDDPYTLYTNAMDYQDARLARIQTEEALIEQVEDTFDAYISVKNSYLSLVDQADSAKKDLDKAKIRNSAGELTYSEFKQFSDDYEELENSKLEAMQLYSTTLYSFDRLTCGGITYYLGDLRAQYGTGGGGESYVIPEYVDGAYYYIKPIVQNNMFQLGVNIPENFEIAITDYELWINGKQVGTRKKLAQSIRHLALDLDGVNRAFIRFYNDTEFIDDVDIDTSVYSGELKIVREYNERPTDKLLATYNMTYSELRNQYEITITPDPTVSEIAFYKVSDSKGRYLLGDELRPIDKVFKYISAVNNSISVLTFEFYDESESLIYKGHADIGKQAIIQDKEDTQE